MKREGYLMARIADPDNLRLAFWKARKGKSHSPSVEHFRGNLDSNLLSLRDELLSGDVCVGDYHYFTITDPKERLICAASFRERVLHHAIMNVCHDSFERFQIYDSYATRQGKGQYAALERTKVYSHRYRWFCKMDVRKFFESIDQDTLLAQLGRRFKDPLLLSLFAQIIGSYEHQAGKGVPIGNLTSQYFANFYLGYADHFAKEVLHQATYVRYMDDVVMWHDCKDVLIRRAADFDAYIASELHMQLKPMCINSCSRGIPMLGYVVFPHRVRLNKASKKRFTCKYKQYNDLLTCGRWTQTDYARHILPLMAFVRFADSRGYRQANVKQELI
jgi:retron-type reverse transcriptase